MQHSTPSPTTADKARFEQIKRVGCVACWLGGYWSRAQARTIEIHHLLSGNKRRGHRYTCGLCAWHHRGEPDMGFTATQMAQRYGPSLARQSKQFRHVFGSDDLLLGAQNAMIEASRPLPSSADLW